MDKETVNALSAIGIAISDVQYKYPEHDEFGFGDDIPTKFVLKGTFYDEIDMARVVEEIVIIRALLHNSNPAVKDLYEKLKTTAGLTSK